MTQLHRDFLVEIGTEELPPKALRSLEQAFLTGIGAGLDRAGLTHGGMSGFATPRRLAVLVRRLAARQPLQHLKRKGPPVAAAFDSLGGPTRAALAFAASCATSVETLQRLDEGKGSFLFFVGTKAGEEAVRVLPAVVQAALDQLPIPRRMHWGDGQAMFVRPVHWVVMLFGKEVVPGVILDTAAGRHTHGHRFHAPKPLSLGTPGAYEKMLRERGYVLADFDSRREKIRTEVTAMAQGLQGRPLISEGLLDEVTALTEWPVPIAGGFEERFLTLPREVLISTLEAHQRYFPLERPDGTLMPAFITVSNIQSRDPDKVREGNERVVRPRLADAVFFFDQDRRQPLSARREALDAVTFQAKLGSLGDKARRVSTLVKDIAPAVHADPDYAVRAAQLAKCDLLTAMVGEFPELQGVMGTYYARADGEPDEVAEALREHYLPRGGGDALPAHAVGTALAIADRLDTIAGIFAIGEKPTGNKDPFALRRAALGVQRILIEKHLELDLKRYIAQAVAAVRIDIDRIRSALPPPAAGAKVVALPAAEAVAAEIYDFLMERLRAYYLEGAGGAAAPGRVAVTTEMFDAVLAARPASPADFAARLSALSTFLDLPEAASLTAANKRIANILKKANESYPAQVDVRHLKEDAEMRLYDAMHALRDAVAESTAQHEYTRALGRLAQLRPAVDTFFEKVMVMDENAELRANRLSLLAQLRGLFAGVADLSRLPG
jgi:glycyl-tRNA synthetase beta chain